MKRTIFISGGGIKIRRALQTPAADFFKKIVEASWELLTHELEGTPVALRLSDGYVNATAMCQAAGKMWADFNRLDSTQEFIVELSSIMGIPIMELTLVKRGGRPAEVGTWVHPEIATYLAMWCSAKFAVQVARWFRDWREGRLPVEDLRSGSMGIPIDPTGHRLGSSPRA